MAFGNGGSGGIAGASDVLLSSPQNEEVLGYDAGSAKWQNQAVAGFAAVAGAKVIVAQDFTTASTARCTGRMDVSVRWRGPVEPTNMIIGDEWYVTTS